jgi:hypothetical protein
MLFQIESRPFNLSYAEWTGKWWQWVFSIPKCTNPLIDDTGKHCTRGQDGPVWYLAGTTGSTYYAERKCMIPGTKAILFPIIVSQFSFAEKPQIMNNSELILHTSKDINQCSLVEAIIDGMNLHDQATSRIRYGPFNLHVRNDNIWDLKAGQTKAVSDGYWVFLKPLPVGDHTIEFHGVDPNFETHVKYRILIGA